MGNFKFDLRTQVRIIVSGEQGEVIGRADYIANESSYLIRYKCADGRAVEQWWIESALTDI